MLSTARQLTSFPGLALAAVWNVASQVIGGLIALGDLAGLITLLGNPNPPLSLFDQGPLEALLATELDLRLVNKWVQTGGKLRFATVGLVSGKLRYVTESGQLLERDNRTPVSTLPSISLDQDACKAVVAAISRIGAEIDALGPAPPPDNPRYENWLASYQSLQAQLQQAQQSLVTCRQANPPAVVPDLRVAINASAALPVFLEPVEIANEHYVDGGIRDVMPVELAAQMGATVIYAVNDAPFGGGTRSIGNVPDPGKGIGSVINIAAQVATAILPDEVGYRSATAVTNSSGVNVYSIQCTFSGPGDSYAIHPGLIRINISFGYMRAADTVKPVAVRPDRCYQLGNDLTALRRLIFTFEIVAADPDRSLNVSNGTMLRWAKGILNMLTAERLNLGGATPADVTGSWTAWEMHRWTLPSTTPFDAFVATPAAPAANFVPVNNTVLKESWAAEILQTQAYPGPAYVILGGAKFPAAITDLNELGLAQAPVHLAPVISDADGLNIFSSVAFIPNIPLEGTLIQEAGVNQVYLIQDGAKVALPADYLTSHGIAPAAVLTAPHGSLAQIPNATLLAEDAAIWVIFGHAKFHVPNPETLTRLYAGAPVTGVFTGCLSGVPTIPVDGTLLRDDSGAISVIYGGAQFHVPDTPTLNRIFPTEPAHQLWNGALSGIPTIPVDRTLLRDDSGAISVVYGGAQFQVPDRATMESLFAREPIHQLWNGALSGIPMIPVDGTLLRDDDGAISVIYGGAQFHVPDVPTLNRLFAGVPFHQLWNGALIGIPMIPVDGTLLREVTNPQVYLIQGGRKIPAPAGAQAAHTLWDGALAQIPS